MRLSRARTTAAAMAVVFTGVLLAACGGPAGLMAATVVPSASNAAPAPSTAAPAASPAAAVDPLAGKPLIARATWKVNSQGRQLQVVPTHAGRVEEVTGADARAWAEVLKLAPDAGSPGMHDQFLCHWNFARVVDPDKPSWNLEPWRPAVGYAQTVGAQCNPGGAEADS